MSENPRLRDNLQAIVLDTNAMGSGSLNMNTLRELPKIMTKFPGLEIWIPEPVIWEWASHAQKTYTDAIIAARSATRKLAQAGIDSGLGVPSEGENLDVQAQVINSLESLPSPFQILRLSDHPEVAVDALRDQIMLTPPAKMKSDVKTGAADSASLRLAQTEAEESAIVYAVVSSDSDIHRALKQWGISDVAVFPNLKILREALLAFQPLELRLITPLLWHVGKTFEDVRAGVVSLGKIDGRGLVEEALGSRDDLLSTDVDVERLGNILLLRSVELDREVGYGTAEVIATGDVQVTGWRMDDRGDELVSDSGTVYNTLLTMAVTFTANETIEDLQIESVTARPRDGYSDDVGALDQLIGITAEVPGLEALVGADGQPAVSTDRRWEADVNGKHVTVTLKEPSLHKDHDWVWSLEIDVSGQKTAVYCYTRNTWADGGDAFHYGRRIALVSDEEPAEFSLARFALSAIYVLSGRHA